jgi:hypothetical protein
MLEEKRGSFEGAIRIPLHASSFFFNDLVFLVIPGKSLKFLTPLFSIPTNPTAAQKHVFLDNAASFRRPLQICFGETGMQITGSVSNHLFCYDRIFLGMGSMNEVHSDRQSAAL